ncbi:MAG TPA: MgtC/SapB family protein [Candidatus Acidoferrales bacterium]|nr:MgtC/SapB family protein [Candidatus Acidoferrales bacterium]
MAIDLTYTIAGKLLLSAALGGVVGLEREVHRKAAGLRTSILICTGACFFMIISYVAAVHPEDDHTRIAAQIIAGIGFLGAGVILRERGNVVGLTTAATVWAIAAVGMGVGTGMYVTSIFATALILISLTTLGWAEARLGIKTRLTTFRLTAVDGDAVMKQAREIFQDMKIPIQHSELRRAADESVMEFDADLGLPQEHELMRRLSLLPARCEMVPIEFQRES